MHQGESEMTTAQPAESKPKRLHHRGEGMKKAWLKMVQLDISIYCRHNTLDQVKQTNKKTSSYPHLHNATVYSCIDTCFAKLASFLLELARKLLYILKA